jgi:hypothetical protein
MVIEQSENIFNVNFGLLHCRRREKRTKRQSRQIFLARYRINIFGTKNMLPSIP